jgi:AraC-like DNA-binding protein
VDVLPAIAINFKENTKMNRVVKLSESDRQIITRLVGPFTDKQVETLLQNIESYIAPTMSIFVPVAGYCDYAIMPDHAHPGYSFVLYLGRPGGLALEGRKVVIPTGKNLCAFSPDVVHQEVLQEGFNSYIAIMIDREVFDQELIKYGKVNGLDLCAAFFTADTALVNHVKMYMAEFNGEAPCRSELLKAYTVTIIHTLIRTCIDCEVLNSSSYSLLEFNALVSYLIENLEKKVSIDDMASYVNMSSSHFAKMFKRHSSVPPMEYLNNLRIEKAKRLIKFSSKNFTEIAFECGFSSSSYFSAKFIEAVKVSPGGYRKTFCKTETC